MKIRRILYPQMWRFVALLLYLTCINATAEPVYRSAELKRLVNALHLNVDSLHEGMNSFVLQDRQVKLLYNNGQISSIGYLLFPEEIIAAAQTPIMSFLERYFLQLDYPMPDRPRDRMLREDRFRFETGSLATVSTIRSDDAFSFSYEQNRYVSTWMRDGNILLSVSFPAEHELISGENKLEAENNVEADILNARMTIEDPINESLLTSTIQKDYYIRQGGNYLSKSLTSDLYYQRCDSSFLLISDASHPLETAANMMLSIESQATCQLKIKQVMYGYRKKYYEVPLRNWIAYCQSNGCKLYYGVETFNPNGIKASVIAVNEAEGYNHVLNVQIPLSVIDTATGIIDAQLETFIPMHNVRNLFAKYQKKKKQSKTYIE